jgi:23S rRNA (adenine2503-C2)-methyltransferase
MGLTRNLSASEIVEQVRFAIHRLRQGLTSYPGHLSKAEGAGISAHHASSTPSRLSNVVFMGMGEPLANYKAVLASIRAMTAQPLEGFGLSVRNITVSTCGLVPRIKQLAAERMPMRLAVSLHAPDDELRSTLVPINKRWGVKQVLDAAREYFDVTGRRVSIEYALIRDVNDQTWRARLLADELAARGRGWVHVNPMPLNATPGSQWQASSQMATEAFVRELQGVGIATSVRTSRGSDIDGACGQLAAKEK